MGQLYVQFNSTVIRKRERYSHIKALPLYHKEINDALNDKINRLTIKSKEHFKTRGLINDNLCSL